MKEEIRISGARQHNLRNITVGIPRNALTVVTGLSGSGKSSLAFDTIYAEGQRRYIESLSSYARQFLEQMEKPDVDLIEGLPPTLSIEQRAAHGGPRSTVATTTEIFDYLRLLFARVGSPVCYECGTRITQQSVEEMVAAAMRWPGGSVATILAPMIRGKKGEHSEVIQKLRRNGYVKARIDGKLADLDAPPRLARYKVHTIEAVVDRLPISGGVGKRLRESLETALDLGDGIAIAAVIDGDVQRDHVFNQRYACPGCGVGYPMLEPRLFSFNSPYGACKTCSGLGVTRQFDEGLIIPDPALSIGGGALAGLDELGGRLADRLKSEMDAACRRKKIPTDKPFCDLAVAQKRFIMTGESGGWAGLIPILERTQGNTGSQRQLDRLQRLRSPFPCPDCAGTRLRPEARNVFIDGKNIGDVAAMNTAAALEFARGLKFGGEKEPVAVPILREIEQRLGFLVDVGLHYIQLDRLSSSLAGGEAQRVRLATQVGSGLVGVCYVLDEPSVGLHARDNRRLLETLCRLRDMGNTVIVVEHDEETMRRADWVVDLGPGAGREGGAVVVSGKLEDVLASGDSLTAAYLKGEKTIPVPGKRRLANPERMLTVEGASEHNLKNVTVSFPLGLFTCVTGVSGSGKSSLVQDVLYRALARRLNSAPERPGAHSGLSGVEKVDKVLQIDQSPIGRSPRSNPSTYTGLFAHIRRIFASTRDAQVRGYGVARFSFNVAGGRCEACEGQGRKRVEMHFLPDVFVTCRECGGGRYNAQTLEVRYRDRNIAEVLAMSVSEALEFFRNYPPIERMLRTMRDVGLGYIVLGQPSTTLSGGEAQRIKLSTELGKIATGGTVYILDEPTTGLHFEDVRHLLILLQRLVDMGNTVIVIEHNLDVVKAADYLIDLGPEGGENGGRIVATGTPEEVAACAESHTGRFLKDMLPPDPTGKTCLKPATAAGSARARRKNDA